MTQPSRFLSRMAIFLVIVLATVALLFSPLRAAFAANAVLNGVILGVLLIGIVHAFRTVTMLRAEVAWIESFRRDTMAITSTATPRLLAPMATMLGERSGKISLSTIAMRTLLDGIATRLDESREISRYMIGLLVFLGLLGTFWGLLGTVQAISNVVGGLQVSGDSITSAFEELKSGLQAPLSGMGTAFSSSLFGLAGSLVLGFLELQAGQAQNRFYNDLEEWLSSLTRLGSGGLTGDAEQSVPAYIQALLEQTADGLENLQRTLARGEENRMEYNQKILQLTDRIGSLTDQMTTEQTLMLKLAENQSELKPLLSRLTELAAAGGIDQQSRTHLRNIDTHLQRMAESGTGTRTSDATQTHLRNIENYLSRIREESATGRLDGVQEIRSEIRLLARTIAALAEDSDRSA